MRRCEVGRVATMKIRNSALAAACLALLLVACEKQSNDPSGQSEIIDVILRAADSPQGTHAELEFEIAGVGEGRGMSAGRWYLNSEADYRDFRSLNISLDPWIVEQLKEQTGMASVDELLGRSIRVQGQAFRVPIYFFCQDRQTEAYYFQTQLPVERMSQIEIL